MNFVGLLGRLTADVELKYSPSGTPIATFSLAVPRKTKEKQTDFVNCVCFNKNAETAAQYVKKGNRLLVLGSLEQQRYTRQDGTKVSTYNVIVNQFDFIESNKNSESQTMSDIPDNDLSYDPFGSE